MLGGSLKDGRVPERTNGTVSNTVVGLGPPWVQIPPLPPIFNSENFYEGIRARSLSATGFSLGFISIPPSPIPTSILRTPPTS